MVSAQAALDGPVVVLNADDHYGPTGIARIVKSLSGAKSTVPSAAMLGFQLSRTLPETGTVSRGVCTRDRTGRLIGLVETHGIGRYGDAIRAVDPVGKLSPEASVSMNIWALPMVAIDRLAEQWAVFHRRHADSPTAEFLLPEALDEQRVEGRLSIEVVDTDEDWIGITNREDLEVARVAFAAMRGPTEDDSRGAR